MQSGLLEIFFFLHAYDIRIYGERCLKSSEWRLFSSTFIEYLLESANIDVRCVQLLINIYREA
jgi:hypothetical protein